MKITRAALQADQRIVKRTRRNNAAYASFGGLLGEQDHDYMTNPPVDPWPRGPSIFIAPVYKNTAPLFRFTTLGSAVPKAAPRSAVAVPSSFLPLPFLPTRTHHPKGRLLLIGGHEQREVPDGEAALEKAPDFILQRFVDELASKNTVLVIPIASKIPEEAAREYVELFPKLGIQHVEVLDIQSRKQANHPDTLALLERASGVMFTGGDQLRLTALLGGTEFLIRLRERYLKEPFVIAGTSAGAAAMSTAMIYQGRNNHGFLKDEIHLSAGLQLLPNAAIDTHFVTRGRIVRMAQIIAANPGCLGIGLEEDTAVLVTEGRELEVLGSGIVVLVDGLSCTDNTLPLVKSGEVFSIRDLRVHLLSRGQRYTMPEQMATQQ